ncbi:M23 family metallopeptidase [Metasolibacillus meyeri]|uniref:M23 family metallopeptidase n=1 Tax=Metasolibacillus meyeri TaxID=1071052 RepID=A0AAW9NWS9_9BACL|nr:M23 family metallopeptidase [Metasolibacillus meyeri]MEC1180479.1 M23 family metallopeptidase [Metasolibacillus meyeri]
MKKKLVGSIFVLALCFSFAGSSLAATIYWPTQSTRITSDYGMRSLDGKIEFHYGLDIGAMTAGVKGDAVKAIHNGVVYSAGYHRSYGNVVFINHIGANQMNYVNVQSVYAHLNTFNVSAGQTVYGNTQIGTMGETGEGVKGVHLHLETRNCPTSTCATVAQSNATNPRTWFGSFLPTSLQSLDEHMMQLSEAVGDLSTDSPNYYPYEELVKMSPEELEAIGYPNPFEFQ